MRRNDMKFDLEVNLKVKWWKERGRKRPARLNQVVNQMKDGRKLHNGRREARETIRVSEKRQGQRQGHTHTKPRTRQISNSITASN